MADEAETMVCAHCGRRFVAPEVVESRRCPRCGGDLLSLETLSDQARQADEARRDD